MPLITHNSYPKKVKIKDPNKSISSTNGAFRCFPVPPVPPALPALGSPTTAASKSFAASSKSPVAKLNSPSSVKPGKKPLKRKNHGSTRHHLGPGTAVTTLQRCTEYFEGFLLLLLMWVLHDIATFERELLEAHGTTRWGCKKLACLRCVETTLQLLQGLQQHSRPACTGRHWEASRNE